MTFLESTRDLAHLLVRLERQAKQEDDRGHFLESEHTWRERDDVRDRRSSMLRVRWQEERDRWQETVRLDRRYRRP